MKLVDRTVSGGVWQSVSITANSLLQVVVVAVLARLISPHEFGTFAIVAMLSAFLLVISEAGFGPALIYRRNLTTGHLNAAFASTTVSGLVFAACLWAIAPHMGVFFENEQVTAVARWFSISIPFSVFGSVSKSLLERDFHFKKIMWTNTISYIFGYALIAIILAVAGFGVWALVVATICQSVMLSIIYFILSPHSIAFKFQAAQLKDLFHFGSGQTLGALFNFISTKADLFIVSKSLDAGQVGIYERIQRIVELPGRNVGLLLNKVLFPAMAEIQTEPQKLKRVYLSGIVLVNASLLPSTALLIITAQEIVNLLLGSRWSAGILPLQVLLITIALRTSVGLSDSLMRAVGAVYRGAWRKAVVALIVIVGSAVGVRWGLPGVAVAVNLSLIARYLLMAHLSLAITTADTKEFAYAHFPGALYALLVTGATLITVHLTRGAGLPDAVVLLASVAGSVAVSMLGLLAWPRLLGQHGIWMLIQILNRMPWQGTRVLRFLTHRLSADQRPESS